MTRGRRAPAPDPSTRLDAPGPRRRRRGRVAVRAAAVGAGVVIAGLPLAGLVAYAGVELPPAPPLAQTSIVYDATGAELARFTQGEDRVLVDLDQVADVMEDALVAAEDRDFWKHDGLDPRGISRALWNDVRGGPVQGGSTITQQLVKNSWLDPERTITRKLKEAVLAIKVEQEHSKAEILERYLNTVYFGRGAYGVQAAAKAYFGVDAASLTLPQAALLAGLIRSPEDADPEAEPKEAERRKTIVLNAMVRTGAISEREADEAKAADLGAVPFRRQTEVLSPGAAHFVEYVRQWVVRKYGEDVAYGGGLRIHTTLDPRLQAAAERSVAEVLNLPTDPAAAVVSIDDTGAVRAMVGGRDFNASKVNYALGREGGGGGRQAGSTFKPIVLAAAIDAGVSPKQRFDGPSSMSFGAGPEPWEVENYGGQSFGNIDLYEATAKSVNTVYAQLMEATGADRVVEMAEKLGIATPIEPDPTLVLGTASVSPLDMARAFMTFGTRGERVATFPVARVTEAGGEVLFEATPKRERALEQGKADVVNDVLRGVIERGTATSARLRVPAAGKTGTTQDYGDAWFVGYTPKISTAVWMGYPEGQAHAMTDVHGRSVTGGSFPAEIWKRFMDVAVEGAEPVDFAEPPADLLAGSSELPSGLRRSTGGSTTTSSSLPADEEPAGKDRDGEDDETTATTRRRDGGGQATTTTTAPATTTTAPAPTTTAPPPTTTTTAPAEPAGKDPAGKP